MKPVVTGTISGYVIWLLVFALLGACLVPIALVVGGSSSASDVAIRTVSPFICPRDTAGTFYSYSTTSYNGSGVEVPATACELHCVDSSGLVVKEDTILYAFLWEAFAAVAALIVMAALAFALAAPAGVLTSRLLRSRARPRS